MCLVCAEWELGKLTNQEAIKNLGELIRSDDEESEEVQHYYQVIEKILDKEVPLSYPDEDQMSAWIPEDDCE